MAIIQSFATVGELLSVNDLRGTKREDELLDKIRAASRLLEMRVGRFLPVQETRYLAAPKSSKRLFLPFPLISITTLVNDGTTLTTDDYILSPSGAHWSNGPYSMLEVDPDASNLSAWDTDANGVVLTGKTGLYDETETVTTLGAEIASASAATMRVANGAKVSPGGIYLIDSEWVHVRETGTPVTSVTTLSANLGANDQTCTVADGSLLNVGEILRRGVEQMRILDINSNTLALQRGWNRTAQSAHTSGQAVDVYRNFGIERGVNGSTAATHSNGVAVKRQLAPADVNELTRKIAVRMLKDASSGYAGRVGDETLGQATYTYILPHELEEVMSRYEIPQVG